MTLAFVENVNAVQESDVVKITNTWCPDRATADAQIDDGEIDKLILEHLPQVRSIAHGFQQRLPPEVGLNDLVQAGTLGLIYAARRFDPRRGVPFAGYANWRIRGAILDSLRELDWASRDLRHNSRLVDRAESCLTQSYSRAPSTQELANAIGWTRAKLQALIGDISASRLLALDAQPPGRTPAGEIVDKSETPYDRALRRELQHALAAAIAALPEKQQRVLALHYFEELTMKEVGAVLGVGEPRVSQIHSAAIQKLRKRLSRIQPSQWGSRNSLPTRGTRPPHTDARKEGSHNV